MKIKQTIRNMVLGGVLLFSLGVGLTALDATPVLAGTCGGTDTAIIDCNDAAIDPNASDLEKSGVWRVLLFVVDLLVAGVGVLALGGIIYGAVLYTSAGGNPDQVKKARTIFTNVVVGVILFGGMYVLLNFLVPGGVFN